MTIKVKDLEYYMSLNYSVLLKYEDDAWFAYVPELPGCMSHGESQQEALEMIEEAKELWIETRLELNYVIPEPE